MSRGPEAYLQMWERAYGVKPNACTNPETKLSPATFTAKVKPGMTSWQTLTAVGQPDRRLGTTFSYCSTGGKVTVQFSSADKVDQGGRAPEPWHRARTELPVGSICHTRYDCRGSGGCP